MDNTMVPWGRLWFAMLKFAVGPCQDVSGWLQISGLSPEPPEDCGACCVNVGAFAGSVSGVPGVPEVGKGMGVVVAAGVGLAVAVGGTGVAVGTACSVSATMVRAAASAVC